ncbi:MAG: hypothetical protein J5509_04800 [Lachnospiraceae bacterium]|nr:hypothetical protein [Lachnospiraceae bacterium]
MSQQNDSNIVQFGGAYMAAPEEPTPEQQVQEQQVQEQQAQAPQQPIQPQQYEQQPVPPYTPPAADPAYQASSYESGLTEYFESERDAADTTGNLGLIFSIAGFFTGLFGLGLLLDLAGITLGAISTRKNPVKKGKGISAIAVGSVGFLLTLAIYGLAYYSYQNDWSRYEDARDYAETHDWSYDTDDAIDVDYDDVTDDTAQSAPREREHYSMGDTVTVHTSYGDYEVTFTGVRETDERSTYEDTDPDRVVLIDYDYKNVSYVMDLDTYYSDDLYINSSDFNFYDANGRAMDDYWIYSNSPHAVTPGHSTSGTMALGLNNDTNYIEVELSDYGYEGPGITVDLNW